MKGILLAGGTGTRLRPMTYVTNKHLLPVYDQPMVYYPIHTLVRNGITEIMVITGVEHMGAMVQTLGDGSDFHAHFTYRVQSKAGGIAQALALAEDFAAGDNVAVILGDNIFEDVSFDPEELEYGCRLFLKQVPDPERFGNPILDSNDCIVKIVEKPKPAHSPYAVTGLYLYDYTVFAKIKKCIPSGRGELEITDVNNLYIKEKRLMWSEVEGFWTDAGTVESLYRATDLVRESANQGVRK